MKNPRPDPIGSSAGDWYQDLGKRDRKNGPTKQMIKTMICIATEK
ncbi:MAG TPA: hypothetical protein VLG69_04610 [Candidatus Andersenbacteria bacterium]|nr:hypothetical protein [Candidatus Andersenbacteria bacterium]